MRVLFQRTYATMSDSTAPQVPENLKIEKFITGLSHADFHALADF